MMVRSMMTPMPPETRKASGSAIGSDQSKSQGALLRMASWTTKVV